MSSKIHPETGSPVNPGADGESTSAGQAPADRVPAAEAAPVRRRRPRRSTAAPATLKQAAALLHTAPAPASSSPDAAHRPGQPEELKGNARIPSGAGRPGSGILPQTAAEDDPRAWGDQPEDTSAWLREQRPPHWG